MSVIAPTVAWVVHVCSVANCFRCRHPHRLPAHRPTAKVQPHSSPNFGMFLYHVMALLLPTPWGWCFCGHCCSDCTSRSSHLLHQAPAAIQVLLTRYCACRNRFCWAVPHQQWRCTAQRPSLLCGSTSASVNTRCRHPQCLHHSVSALRGVSASAHTAFEGCGAPHQLRLLLRSPAHCVLALC